MPIERSVKKGVLHTVLIGVVTNEELFSYYESLFHDDDDRRGAWREVVDGRQITEMRITPEGQKRMAGALAQVADRLRGGKVAMVASTEVVYGMFRMWQIQRDHVRYEVEVFREIKAAVDWVQSE